MSRRTLFKRLTQGKSGSFDITALIALGVEIGSETRTLVLTGNVKRSHAFQLVFAGRDQK